MRRGRLQFREGNATAGAENGRIYRGVRCDERSSNNFQRNGFNKTKSAASWRGRDFVKPKTYCSGLKFIATPLMQ